MELFEVFNISFFLSHLFVANNHSTIGAGADFISYSDEIEKKIDTIVDKSDLELYETREKMAELLDSVRIILKE